MNSMASFLISWQELQEHFYKALDEGAESIQAFVNTELAELWESAGEKIDEEILKNRRHYYECDVPENVAWITAGVDVQLNRLEYEIVGWGPGEESWGLQYGVIPGDTAGDDVWDMLDEIWRTTFTRADGVVLPIACVGIDSQYRTSRVLAYCKPRNARGIWAIRGEGGPGRPIVDKVRRRGKNHDMFVFPVGTDASKDQIFSYLEIDSEGSGYSHYPRESEFKDRRPRGYDEAYFHGLLTERRERRRHQGRTYHVWVKPKVSARNEPLDTRVYATAALRINYSGYKKMLDRGIPVPKKTKVENRDQGEQTQARPASQLRRGWKIRARSY